MSIFNKSDPDEVRSKSTIVQNDQHSKIHNIYTSVFFIDGQKKLTKIRTDFGPRFRPLEQSFYSCKSPQGGVGEVVWTSYELKKTIVMPHFYRVSDLRQRG